MSFRGKIESKGFALVSELIPPKSADVSSLVDRASHITDQVDAFYITDMPGGVMRMSPIGAASAIGNQQIDILVQIGCRNRNRVALQGDLLSLQTCGVSGVIISEGDDPAVGDHHKANSVEDIGGLELIEAVAGLCAGRDLSGATVASPPDLLLGAAIEEDGAAEDAAIAMEEVRQKSERGAQFFISPPVFDAEIVKPLADQCKKLGVSLLFSVVLLKSAGMARYMHHHQKNVLVPDSIFDRLLKASDKNDECVRIASEIVAAARNMDVAGVLLSTFGMESRIEDIIRQAAALF